jgi:hypothetical protein
MTLLGWLFGIAISRGGRRAALVEREIDATVSYPHRSPSAGTFSGPVVRPRMIGIRLTFTIVTDPLSNVFAIGIEVSATTKSHVFLAVA